MWTRQFRLWDTCFFRPAEVGVTLKRVVVLFLGGVLSRSCLPRNLKPFSAVMFIPAQTLSYVRVVCCAFSARLVSSVSALHARPGQFIYVIRKRIKLDPEKAIFIFVNDTIPQTCKSSLFYVSLGLRVWCESSNKAEIFSGGRPPPFPAVAARYPRKAVSILLLVGLCACRRRLLHYTVVCTRVLGSCHI